MMIKLKAINRKKLVASVLLIIVKGAADGTRYFWAIRRNSPKWPCPLSRPELRGIRPPSLQLPLKSQHFHILRPSGAADRCRPQRHTDTYRPAKDGSAKPQCKHRLFLFSSLMAAGDTLLPHRALVISSNRHTETPAWYISMRDSSRQHEPVSWDAPLLLPRLAVQFSQIWFTVSSQNGVWELHSARFCKLCIFLSFFNLCNLLYIIPREGSGIYAWLLIRTIYL